MAFALGAGAASLAGCSVLPDTLTGRLFKDTDYQEQIASLLISADGSSFVVLTERYHYVFAAPASFVQALRSPFHHALVGRFDRMSVDSDGSTRLFCSLQLDPTATPLEVDQAASIGFVKSTLSTELKGRRYDAGGVPVPAAALLALNRTYRIDVRARLSRGETAARVLVSPITVAADGTLVLVAVASSIFLLPIMLPVLPMLLGGGSIGRY